MDRVFGELGRMKALLPEKLDRIQKTGFLGLVDNKVTPAFFGLKDVGHSGDKGLCVMRLLMIGVSLAFFAFFNASPACAQAQEQAAAVDAKPTEALPASNDAPPVEPVDPLAEFKRAQTNVAKPATEAPAPTPGGFQQSADGAVTDQSYDLQSIEEDTEAKQAEFEQKAREQAFDAALNGMMPMTPDQIRALLDKYRVTREASEERIGGMPKPEVSVQTVSLEPGVAPPIIKLSPGHVTSVTMMDMTGEPWPVQDVSWGGNFEIISPEDGGHIIRISPMAAHEVGNMSVQLIGLKTPVTFTLETQLEVVQYRFDARIPEYGPKAAPPIIEPGLDTEAGTDKAIGQILDGVPPAGTQKIKLSGVDARTSVYRNGAVTYLRTPLTLLSPGWSASAKSADGMTVYVVNSTPVFLLSDRGRMVRAVVADNGADQ
ncbi:MAG: type IV secretion protein DotH [Proteobacteria bacterium]|nr:type IV secretion protein DotH [Pseudomonadota bacterium]